MSIDGMGWNLPTPPMEPFELNPNSPQAAGLVAWWPTLASRGMSKLRDMSGRGLDGTFNGGLTWNADGQMGSALQFDGASGYVQANTTATSGLSALTWFVRARRIGTPALGDTIGGKWRDVSDEFLLKATTSSTVYMRAIAANAVGTLVATDTIALDQNWHDWTLVYLSPAVYLYRDGIQIASASNVGGAVNSTRNQLEVGKQIRINPGDNSYWTGLISEARLYSRALSPAEIYQMYDPATRWELYKPLKRLWAVSVPGAVSISPDLAGLGGATGVSIGGVQ